MANVIRIGRGRPAFVRTVSAEVEGSANFLKICAPRFALIQDIFAECKQMRGREAKRVVNSLASRMKETNYNLTVSNSEGYDFTLEFEIYEENRRATLFMVQGRADKKKIAA